MSIFSIRVWVRAFMLVGFTVGLVSCSDLAGAGRQVVHPAGVTYVNREELRSRMHVLRYEMLLLDLATVPSDDLSEQQQQVGDILSNIELIAASIDADVAGSNHPFLQNDMTSFLATVAQARTAAALNPPRYYEAGRVSGGCINCHRTNGG